MIGQERAAIAALKGGDMRGLEFLVQRHQLLALRIAYHITRSQDLAEDVAADRRITSLWPAPPFHLFLSRCMPAGLTDHMADHILPFRVEGGRRDREIWVAAAGGGVTGCSSSPCLAVPNPFAPYDYPPELRLNMQQHNEAVWFRAEALSPQTGYVQITEQSASAEGAPAADQHVVIAGSPATLQEGDGQTTLSFARLGASPAKAGTTADTGLHCEN